MRDRIHWQTPTGQPPQALCSKIKLTIDLAPDKPGGERSDLERALRTLFPSGFTREDVRWLAGQAITACASAIVKQGFGSFPLEAVLLNGHGRVETKPTRANDNVIGVEFRSNDAAA